MVGAALLFGLALAIALTVACDSFIGHKVIRFFGSRKARRGVDSADPVRQVTAISAMFDSKKKPRRGGSGARWQFVQCGGFVLGAVLPRQRVPDTEGSRGAAIQHGVHFRFRPKN